MSLEHEVRVFQRFLPGEFKELWRARESEVAGIDLQRSQELIENLEFPPETSFHLKARLLRQLSGEGIETLGQLFSLDLNNPPRGLGQKSTEIIERIRENLLLIEKRPLEPSPLEISLTQNLDAVLDFMIRSGIFPPEIKGLINSTEQRIQETPQNFRDDLASFFAYMSGRGFPLNLEEQESEITRPAEALPIVVRFLYRPGLGHNMLITWGDPLYDRVEKQYQRQQERLQVKSRRLGVEENPEYDLPFIWFWSDFYYYRGLWFWQGRPDEDQLDSVGLMGDSLWERLSSALIFRLEAPPSFIETRERQTEPPEQPAVIKEATQETIQEAVQEEAPLLAEEDLPEETRGVLNFPEEPLRLPLSAHEMAGLTGWEYHTVLILANKGIFGHRSRRLRSHWRFNDKDVLTAAVICKRGQKYWVSPADKRAISQSIKAGLSPAVILRRRTLSKKEKRKSPGARQATRERLTRRRKALKESQLELTKPLSLRKAAQFIRQVLQERYPSYASLDQLVKIAVILGDFPLPPEVIRVSAADVWHYHFTDRRQLVTVFDTALEVFNNRYLRLEEIFQQARNTFREERKQRSSIEALVPLILRQLDFPAEIPGGKRERVKRFLFAKLQAGELPLPLVDLRPQEILILGVPQEDQEDFVSLWAEFLEENGGKMTRPPTDVILKTWPALTVFLKEQLGEIKINLHSVRQAITWLRAEGVSIIPVKQQRSKGYRGYYDRLSPLRQARLKALLQFPEKRQVLIEILGRKRT